MDQFLQEQHALDELEKGFQQTFEQIPTSQSIELMRQEYCKLHAYLKVSHENQRRLINICGELSKEAVKDKGKLENAVKLASDDGQTIVYLKKELETCYKVLEKAREREEKSKVKIDSQNLEIQNLTKHLQEHGSQGQIVPKQDD